MRKPDCGCAGCLACDNFYDDLRKKVEELEGELQEYKSQLESASSALEEIKETSARAWREIGKV